MHPFLRQLTCAACVLLASAVAYAQQKPAAQLRGFSVVLVQGDQPNRVILGAARSPR